MGQKLGKCGRDHLSGKGEREASNANQRIGHISSTN